MVKPVAGFDTNPQNINKKGAPKREWTMKSLIIEALEEVGEDGIPKNKKVAKKLVSLAERGSEVAIKEVNNRTDGMPKQSTDITSGGEKLEISFHSSLKQK